MSRHKEINSTERRFRSFWALELNVGKEIADKFRTAFPDGMASLDEMVALVRKLGYENLDQCMQSKKEAKPPS